MGTVPFEVGFFFAGIMIYFAIGNYYKILSGLFLALLSVFLYSVGLLLGLSLFSRIILQAIPFAVMMYRQTSGNLTLDKNKKMCPVCGFLNDRDADFCHALHCDAALGNDEKTSKLSYYLPPKVVAGIIVFIAGGSVLYDNSTLGKLVITIVYGAWPAIAMLCVLLYILYKVR